jgi:hypothetical protein
LFCADCECTTVLRTDSSYLYLRGLTELDD